MNESNELVSIQQMIHEIRGQKVMLDSDLAILYGVDAKVLNQAVKRNIDRFPLDFMFQLTSQEVTVLRSQIVTSSRNWGGRRYLPYVFTEHGVLMLASVLKSNKAVEVSIQVARTFVKLRQYVIEQSAKDSKFEEIREMLLLHIESNDSRFSEHSNAIDGILEALYNLSSQAKERKKIGFDTKSD